MRRSTPPIEQSGSSQQERPGTHRGNATRLLRPRPNPVDQFGIGGSRSAVIPNPAEAMTMPGATTRSA